MELHRKQSNGGVTTVKFSLSERLGSIVASKLMSVESSRETRSGNEKISAFTPESVSMGVPVQFESLAVGDVNGG